MIARGEWDDVLRYAAALEQYTGAEPLPWSNVFIARSRVLAGWAQGLRDDSARAALEAVRETLQRAELKSYLPRIEMALAVA